MTETNELWNYSLATYAKNGVEACCLKLQDDYDLNVNILLFCCWLADAEDHLSRERMATLVANFSSWQQDIVKPLRESRRALSHYGDSPARGLREEVKRIELEAERIELLRLQASIAAFKPHGRGATESATRTDRLLSLYVDCANIEVSTALQDTLLQLRLNVLSQT